jgi:carboxymethylenebutenolidase
MSTVLTSEPTTMLAVWQRHAHAEFVLKDPGTGGEGRRAVFDFYDRQFLPAIPRDIELLPVSLVCGADRIVEEMVVRFTHSLSMNWMLPGVPATGRKVEFMLVAIIGFEGGRIASEHIYWDQTTVLSQLGVLHIAPAVTGVGSTSRIRRLVSASQCQPVSPR